jgi:hypothetical protein
MELARKIKFCYNADAYLRLDKKFSPNIRNGTNMNRWIIRFRRCLPLLTAWAFCGFAGQDFKYNFEPGHSFVYSVEMKSTAEGQGMGQDYSLSSRFSIDCLLTAVDKNDSTFTVLILFRSFKGVLNFPLMGFYDSSFSMNEWTDKRIRLVFTPHGKILTAQALDDITMSKMGMMLRIGPVEIAQRLILELPPQEIDTNVIWRKTNPETINQAGVNISAKPNIEYKLGGREVHDRIDCRKMIFGGSSTLEGSGTTQGVDVSIDGTIKTDGAALFAEGNGLLVSVRQNQETDLTQTLSGSQTGAVIIMSKNSVTMELKQ